MAPVFTFTYDSKTWKRVGGITALVFLLWVVSFSAFYLLSGYDQLVKRYMGLTDCFYKKETWTEVFFTPQAKSAGNTYCGIAIIVALACGWYLLKKLLAKHPEKEHRTVTIDLRDLLFAAVCFVVITCFWLWGYPQALPTSDETFSANDCADMHPFQTISYYMLPNNHMFFNLLNSVLFHWVNDKVISGRIISLGGYWVLIITVFYWLRELFGSRWLALFAALVLALQLPVWGFSFQARGYELMALASWAGFLSLFRFLNTSDARWLLIYVGACVAGYFCLPSFLCFHAALVLYAVIFQLVNKKAYFLFWKGQLFGIMIVFLCYLPCLCFSGLDKITANPFVLPYKDYSLLATDIVPMFRDYMDYCFADVLSADHWVDLVLLLLPFSLFFYTRNRTAFLLGVFYLSMWGAFVFFVIITKIFPIDRTLPGFFSITLAMMIYAVYMLLLSLAQRLKVTVLPAVILPVLLFCLAFNYVKKDKADVAHYLCHFPMNDFYTLIEKKCIIYIPKDSSVAFSNEAFYWYYICRENRYHVVRCLQGNEAYFVKKKYESFPPHIEGNYLLIKDLADFEIYKRK